MMKSSVKQLPIVYQIEERTIPERTYSVRLNSHNTTVLMRMEGNDCEIAEEPIIPTRFIRTGCRLHWEGSIREFTTLFYPKGRNVSVKEAFRNFVIAWYCRRNETVIIPESHS